MWRAFYQAFNRFWNPTPELQAAMALPFRERINQLGEWSYWRANFRWPVIWRRVVVMQSGSLAIVIVLFAIIGFETVALERQKQALLSPSVLSDESLEKLDQAMKAQARADRALASYYCSIGVDPHSAGLKFRCR